MPDAAAAPAAPAAPAAWKQLRGSRPSQANVLPEPTDAQTEAGNYK
ncbi:hypothetical protein [Delftia sp.]|nr:hypothetical protein [Delftia sp.]